MKYRAYSITKVYFIVYLNCVTQSRFSYRMWLTIYRQQTAGYSQDDVKQNWTRPINSMRR